MRSSSKMLAYQVVVAIVVMAAGFFIGRWTVDETVAETQVARGWATTSDDYMVIALYGTEDDDGESGSSHPIGAARWSDQAGRSGDVSNIPPSCFTPDSISKRVPVEIGFVMASAVGNHFGGEVVVWLTCL